MSPGLPIILIEGVLNGHNGVLLDVAEIQIRKLLASDPLGGVGVGVLEVKVVLAFLIEFGRCDVEGNFDLALIARLLDGLTEELERLFSTRDVGSKASLVTNIDG